MFTFHKFKENLKLGINKMEVIYLRELIPQTLVCSSWFHLQMQVQAIMPK